MGAHVFGQERHRCVLIGMLCFGFVVTGTDVDL
jgi:hypothetical protein